MQGVSHHDANAFASVHETCSRHPAAFLRLALLQSNLASVCTLQSAVRPRITTWCRSCLQKRKLRPTFGRPYRRSGFARRIRASSTTGWDRRRGFQTKTWTTGTRTAATPGAPGLGGQTKSLRVVGSAEQAGTLQRLLALRSTLATYRSGRLTAAGRSRRERGTKIRVGKEHGLGWVVPFILLS